MKTISLIIITIVLSCCCIAQDNLMLKGSYLAKVGTKNHLWLFVDGYSSYIEFENDKYLRTWGGPFKLSEDGISIQIEYDDSKQEDIGKQKNMQLQIKENEIKYGDIVYKREPPKEQALDGLWRITGRVSENKLSEITYGDRKTIKILIDGYFQWIAINPAEKGFYGTGGGKYSFDNQIYQENILFFSRDNSRVGAQLQFKGEIKDLKWHHSGKSSKGDPIYEVWTLENQIK